MLLHATSPAQTLGPEDVLALMPDWTNLLITSATPLPTSMVEVCVVYLCNAYSPMSNVCMHSLAIPTGGGVCYYNPYSSMSMLGMSSFVFPTIARPWCRCIAIPTSACLWCRCIAMLKIPRLRWKSGGYVYCKSYKPFLARMQPCVWQGLVRG